MQFKTYFIEPNYNFRIMFTFQSTTGSFLQIHDKRKQALLPAFLYIVYIV